MMKKVANNLFAPYGRGAGFSVLDVSDNEEPVHWFSILNDRINRRVLVAMRSEQFNHLIHIIQVLFLMKI